MHGRLRSKTKEKPANVLLKTDSVVSFESDKNKNKDLLVESVESDKNKNKEIHFILMSRVTRIRTKKYILFSCRE